MFCRWACFPPQLPFNLPEEHVRVPASLPSVTEKVFENKVRLYHPVCKCEDHLDIHVSIKTIIKFPDAVVYT